MTDNLIRIPLGGNAFLESTASGGIVTERGITNWHDPRAVFGIYIRLRSASRFRAAIRMRPQTREATLRLTCGSRTLEAAVPEGASEVSFGDFETTAPGYVRFELSGVSKSGNLFASPTELVLYGITPEIADAYVPPEERNNYYWTRRGPSVHGTYDLSEIGETEWFYNEATVPAGFDPIGTYAMAIGFRGGYFGMQTNSPTQRRILFSIWSPHVTDDPNSVPENRRVICTAKGERTHVGEFGGEGSGGQSYVTHPWETGVTQKFLVRAHPDGEGRTEFSAWYYFHDLGRFGLVASFLRPETDTRIVSPHSFLENFIDTNGHLRRMACFTNAWAFKDGRWIAPRRIRLTVDNTARQKWRLDCDGSLSPDGTFTLANGGFSDAYTEPGTIFERDVSRMTPPDFDPNDLLK